MLKRTLVVLIWMLMLATYPVSGAENPAMTSAKSATGLAYDILGNGPLVVFIHGSNLDRRLWSNEINYLSDSFTILRYDLRGLGESDTATEQYSDHQDLLALLDELEWDKATLVGLSAGVQVALDTVLTAPQRINQLVLVSPTLNEYSDDDRPAYLADLVQALGDSNLNRANQVLLNSDLMRVAQPYSELVSVMVLGSRQWQLPYQLMERSSLPALDNLQTIETPTLILTGANDYRTVENLATLLQSQMPNASKTIVPGGGHLLNLTSPDAFGQALTAFLLLDQ